MSTPLVIVGGGEHARVVIEAARSQGGVFHVAGFVDPRPCVETARLCAVPRLGGDDAIAELAAAWNEFVLGVGAIGDAAKRRRVVASATQAGARWCKVVHATAWISPTAKIEPGAVVMAGAILNAGAQVCAHAVVNTGAIVEHDVVVGEFAQLAPGVVVGGGVQIEPDAYLGLGCRVRDHVRIGRGAMVGMGAAVVADVADGATVVGVPARPRGSHG